LLIAVYKELLSGRNKKESMRIKILTLLLLLAQAGWAQNLNVTEAELLGTWLHFSTSETLGGKEKALAPIEIKWTFEAGGRGTFSQKVSASGKAWLGPMDWSLEGSTIILDGRTRYTVVRSGKDAMVWENQKLGNFYHVRKLQ